MDGKRELPQPVSTAQVSELLSTFQRLREQRQSLMAHLRESMYEMQAQRSRLRQEARASGSEQEHGAPASGRPPAHAHLQVEYGMTPREIEVALLLAEGCSNSKVAARLGISPHTARHHTQRVLGKLGVRSRSEAGARLRR
ncbi:MAG TPA: LuxR C-terminal-related transcriptional regulator [Gemmatimonadales bacterium]|nr:LuxR C-terminal-related transcriptional regulator [Gemmatimonadales bacterium]